MGTKLPCIVALATGNPLEYGTYLENKFMCTGNAIRVLEAEELQGLDEKAHHNGTHKEGAGTT